MEITLDPNTIKGVANRLTGYGSSLHETRTREEYLDRLGKILTQPRTTVQLGEDAWCSPDDDGYLIEIPINPGEQPVTNLDVEVWYLLSQETTLFHEAGHAMWSDFDRFGELKDDAESPIAYKEIYNGGEDGCIDTFLVNEFDIEADMVTNYANKTADIPHELMPVNAIAFGLLDHGFFDSGIWQGVKDGDVEIIGADTQDIVEFEDQIQEVMEKALMEENGARRAEIFYDFYEDVVDILPDSVNEGESSGTGGDDVGEEGSQQDTPETPDDVDFDDEESDHRSSATDIEEDDVKDEYEEEVQRQGKEEEQSDRDSNLLDQLELLSDDDSNHSKLTIPTDWEKGDESDSYLNMVKTEAESLKRILQAKLQNERNSSRRYGTRTGSLESSQLAYTETGRRDIRSDEVEPEDKSYSVLILLDRTGSMDKPKDDDGDYTKKRIKEAQRATGQMAFGLHNVGVDVSIMSLYDNKPTLEVPFGDDPRDHTEKIFSNETDGRTQIHKTLNKANIEIENGEFDEHFILVITDGQPDNESKYKEELDEIRSKGVPVYGVYINENKLMHGNHDEYFDAVRYAIPEETHKKCRELCHAFIG